MNTMASVSEVWWGFGFSSLSSYFIGKLYEKAVSRRCHLPSGIVHDRLFYGEAIYFQSRCSQYKTVDFKRAVFAYCLANKAYNSGCSAKAAARNFLKGSAEGLNAAKAKYTAMSDKQVCKIAESRFGKNGTVYKNMLQRRCHPVGKAASAWVSEYLFIFVTIRAPVFEIFETGNPNRYNGFLPSVMIRLSGLSRQFRLVSGCGATDHFLNLQTA